MNNYFTNRIFGALAGCMLHLLAVDSHAQEADQEPPTEQESDDFKSRATRILEEAVPELEREFRDQVLLPVLSADKTITDQYEAYARWLLKDDKLPERSRVRLVTSTDVFIRTISASSGFDRSNIHVEPRSLEENPTVSSVLRIPEGESAPTAVIFAVVEVQVDKKRTYYAVEKTFEYKLSKWVVRESRTRPYQLKD